MRGLIQGSATDTLIRAMESLQEAEESEVMILVRHSNGESGYFSNLPFVSSRIGLLQAELFYHQAQIQENFRQGQQDNGNT